MDLSIYLREGVVFLPTTGKIPRAYSVIGEPVDVVDASETAELKRAFHRAIARGNPTVPMPPLDDDPNDFALVKYAGVKTLAAFDRGLRIWRLSDHRGIYRIIGYKPRRDRGWEEDHSNIVTFTPGTPLDEVIDRAIAIDQEKAKEKTAAIAPRAAPEIIAPPSSSEPPDDPPLALPKDYVQLAPAERNDELGDFLEWLVNCEPKDASAIRAEIKRYFYDVGDRKGGDAFTEVLGRVLDGWPLDRKSREAMLVELEPFTRIDPREA